MKLIMSWKIIMFCCALAFTPVSAQQRDRDGRDGGGYRDRGDRGGGYSRGYERGRQQARRQYYRDRRPGYVYHQGYGWYDPSAVIGGAIGGWLWRQWAQPEPVPEAAPIRDAAWCAQRYRSYDWYTKTYLGYDGLRHGCP